MGNCQCACNDDHELVENPELYTLKQYKEEFKNLFYEAKYKTSKLTLSSLENLTGVKREKVFSNNIFKNTDDYIFFNKLELILLDIIFIVDVQIQTIKSMEDKKYYKKQLMFDKSKIIS